MFVWKVEREWLISLCRSIHWLLKQCLDRYFLVYFNKPLTYWKQLNWQESTKACSMIAPWPFRGMRFLCLALLRSMGNGDLECFLDLQSFRKYWKPPDLWQTPNCLDLAGSPPLIAILGWLSFNSEFPPVLSFSNLIKTVTSYMVNDTRDLLKLKYCTAMTFPFQ